MIKRMIAKVLTPFSPKQHNFTVGYDKDTDQYFPRPTDLENLDQYEVQKEACDRVNATMQAIKQVRSELPAYDGSTEDRNPKEGEVAVFDLEIGGRKVDAAFDKYKDIRTTLELRLKDRALGGNLVAENKHYQEYPSSDSAYVKTDKFGYNLSRRPGESYAILNYWA